MVCVVSGCGKAFPSLCPYAAQPGDNHPPIYVHIHQPIIYGVGDTAEVDGGGSGAPDAVSPGAASDATSAATAAAAPPLGAGAHHVPPPVPGPLHSV
ncbi:hypothetical protein SAY87_029307 [Trapa incisa]|uniref:Uncharacterized protein n=1 Tax=Trapa incisa TaxID=236973 RepID=A0AAN7KBF6_9MYRT|nr:hypothetical protein SAY87_029307 [Trapa incisa]